NALGIREAAQRHLIGLFERRFAARVEAFTGLPAARHIGGRLMVVHDSGDDIVPHDHSTAMLREIPGATLLTTRDLGHSALTRDTATIQAIADFLDGTRA